MTMISRKRILSNSCSHLSRTAFDDDEDSWFDTRTLLRDHIQEIVKKCYQLDDEIWGKIILMERNRRVAKAYARAPLINLHGGSDGFDGDSIGLSGFDNPFRDREVILTQRMVGRGFLIGADEDGNIILDVGRRHHQPHVTVTLRDVDPIRCSGPPTLRPYQQASGSITSFPAIIFDMKKFLKYLNHELRRESNSLSREAINRLQSQCVSVMAISVAGSDSDYLDDDPLLEKAVWVMVVNIIGLEMLQQNVNQIYHHGSSSSHDSSDLMSATSTDGRIRTTMKRPQTECPRTITNRYRKKDVVTAHPVMRNQLAHRHPPPKMTGRGTIMLQPSRKRTDLESLWTSHKDMDDNEEDEDNDSALPTPDYDSELDMSPPPPRSGGGFLNSVLRHLPIQSSRVIQPPPPRLTRSVSMYQESWTKVNYLSRQRRPPTTIKVRPPLLDPTESDESVTHIYSSIADSQKSAKSDHRGNRQPTRRKPLPAPSLIVTSSSDGKKVTTNIRPRVKRSATIPKTLRFFMRIAGRTPSPGMA